MESSSHPLSTSCGDRQGIYKLLDRTLREIRVIKILPDPDNQPVRCELHIQSLISNIRYAALSYVWGDAKVTKDILVNGQLFSATTNLASALWNLRKYGFPTNEQTGAIQRLWVDAICINQDDVPEKNHQVFMMGSIYRNASSVLSWLGPPELGHFDQALENIREVFPILDRPQISLRDARNAVNKLVEKLGPVLRNVPGTGWEYLDALKDSEYWRRAWVIQEMALAASPYTHWFICGKESVTMRELDAFDRFAKHVSSNSYMACGYDQSSEGSKNWQNIEQSDLGMPSLCLVRRYQRVASDDSTTLFSAACQSAILVKAGDPRDLVYAMLSLTTNDIIPDYRKSVQDVYLDALGCGTELDRNISLSLELAGCGFYDPSEHSEAKYKLFSWLPDLPKMLSRAGPHFKKDGPMLNIQQVEITRSGVVRIQGAVCSRVKLVKRLDFVRYENVNRVYRNLTGLSKLSVDYIVEFVGVDNAILQTREGNRKPLRELFDVLDWQEKDERKKIDHFQGYSGLCMSAVSWCYLTMCLLNGLYMIDSEKNEAIDRLGLRPGGLDLGGFLASLFDDMPKCSGDSGPALDHTALDMIEMLGECVDRTLFQTDNGQLGIGPPYLQQGDLICAVHHVTLPILLRKVEPHGSNESHLEHVGSCYVSGLSDGEPAEMVNRGELEIETFEIY